MKPRLSLPIFFENFRFKSEYYSSLFKKMNKTILWFHEAWSKMINNTISFHKKHFLTISWLLGHFYFFSGQWAEKNE